MNLGGVNCYLVKSKIGFVLVDTGFSMRRSVLVQKLEKAGCRPGNLQLIVITHGDMDHAGNAAFLREKYGAKVAIHAFDAGMVKDGSMGANRKAKPDRLSLVFKIMMVFTRRLAAKHPVEKFTPDLEIDEGFDLSQYGLDGRVLHIPGHSKGSIGVLTAKGDLFCGDLFYNIRGFRFVDDLEDYESSLKKLAGLKIGTVYPGHGKPFPISRAITYQAP
jgi:glyoxylase-like metal-dependent hydrolase (beta-lactamase superfamily II)